MLFGVWQVVYSPFGDIIIYFRFIYSEGKFFQNMIKVYKYFVQGCNNFFFCSPWKNFFFDFVDKQSIFHHIKYSPEAFSFPSSGDTLHHDPPSLMKQRDIGLFSSLICLHFPIFTHYCTFHLFLSIAFSLIWLLPHPVAKIFFKNLQFFWSVIFIETDWFQRCFQNSCKHLGWSFLQI